MGGGGWKAGRARLAGGGGRKSLVGTWKGGERRYERTWSGRATGSVRQAQQRFSPETSRRSSEGAAWSSERFRDSLTGLRRDEPAAGDSTLPSTAPSKSSRATARQLDLRPPLSRLGSRRDQDESLTRPWAGSEAEAAGWPCNEPGGVAAPDGSSMGDATPLPPECESERIIRCGVPSIE
jgi:hypothetical protein